MHQIIVAPVRETNSLRKSGQRFTARYKGVLLGTSETPFFDAARELLKRNWASPDDIMTMRHEGADTWAMRASVSRAAACAIKQRDRGRSLALENFEPYAGPGTKSSNSIEAA